MAASLVARPPAFARAAPRAPAAPRCLRVCATRELEGKVVSDKMDKTAVVRVARYQKEARYGKRILQSKKYKAHDENNECEEGDIVAIRATTKRSKTKSSEVVRIIRKVVKL